MASASTNVVYRAESLQGLVPAELLGFFVVYFIVQTMLLGDLVQAFEELSPSPAWMRLHFVWKDLPAVGLKQDLLIV